MLAARRVACHRRRDFRLVPGENPGLDPVFFVGVQKKKISESIYPFLCGLNL